MKVSRKTYGNRFLTSLNGCLDTRVHVKLWLRQTVNCPPHHLGWEGLVDLTVSGESQWPQLSHWGISSPKPSGEGGHWKMLPRVKMGQAPPPLRLCLLPWFLPLQMLISIIIV